MNHRFLTAMFFLFLLSLLFTGCSSSSMDNTGTMDQTLNLTGTQTLLSSPTPTLRPDQIWVTVTPRPTANVTPSSLPSDSAVTPTESAPLTLLLTKSPYDVDTCDFASISIVEDTLTEKGATIEFTYTGETSGTTGEWFNIEVNIDGEWYGMPFIYDNTGFDSIGYEIKKDTVFSHEYNWNYIYGALRPGFYRIVCEISDDSTRPYTNYYLADVFTIE